MYGTLTSSSNYVTKRQSLKLLGEILLDRANFNVMTRYIANESNLKVVMNLLKDKSKNIQFEAFHVFKVGFRYHRLKRTYCRLTNIHNSAGFRRQPEEACWCRGDTEEEQRQTSFLPPELPQRQGG